MPSAAYPRSYVGVDARVARAGLHDVDHRFVAGVSKSLGCTVLIGVRVGDRVVFTDYVGDKEPNLIFVARTRARRPLCTSAAGKVLLGNVAEEEMYRPLDLAGPEHAADALRFVAELPDIRSRRVAFNREATFADAYVVETPLLAPDGSRSRRCAGGDGLVIWAATRAPPVRTGSVHPGPA